MHLEKIKFLKDVNNIKLINKGYSGAYKYSFIKNGQKYFLKIGKFKITNNLEELFKKYAINHPTIVDCGKYDNDLNYIIEEYINGIDLKEELKKHDSKFIYEYGFEIGSQYRNLRILYPDKPMTEEKYKEYLSMVDERINKLKILIIYNNKLTSYDYNFLIYIISFFYKNIHIIKNSYLVFGHTDIKPSNYLLYDKNIIATDIEQTDYKELSLSMIWSFARDDYNDEKNLAFTRGYLDALFNFQIPETILECFNLTYLYNIIRYFINYIEKEEYAKLSHFIEHIKTNYIIEGELKISEKLKSILFKSNLEILKDYNITIVKGSYNPDNLVFKCQKEKINYFLKFMKMSFKQYKKSINSYELLNKCNIPISPILNHGCLLKDKCYYTISNFIELKEMNKSISNTYKDGHKSGELIASYLVKLKGKKLKGAKTFESKQLLKSIMEIIEEIYENNEKNKYIYWSKKELMNYITYYIKSFDEEPISLIHGDVKFGNILYDGKNIYFADNESLMYSYDIINFMYNIHIGFLDNKNSCYKGFVNSYLKYMNNGKIPYRIQNQVKLLLIYYILRTTKKILDNNSDESKLKLILKSCKHYIDEDNDIEWLK